jgi:hypothetical protein
MAGNSCQQAFRRATEHDSPRNLGGRFDELEPAVDGEDGPQALLQGGPCQGRTQAVVWPGPEREVVGDPGHREAGSVEPIRVLPVGRRQTGQEHRTGRDLVPADAQGLGSR